VDPSTATSRHDRENAPGVPGVATGTQARSNNAASTSGPSRERALEIAGDDGTRQIPRQRAVHASPCTSLRITSSYPSEANNANAIT
jgi:hypothetical protein